MTTNVIGTVRVKPGVQFTTIAPAGFRLLGAIEMAARSLGLDVVITSACDGLHSGPNDPHHRGEAYDIRTHDLTPAQKAQLLHGIIDDCVEVDEPNAVPVEGVPQSLAGARFFGFLERPGTADEHLHVQLRKGHSYPAD